MMARYDIRIEWYEQMLISKITFSDDLALAPQRIVLTLPVDQKLPETAKETKKQLQTL